MPRIGNASEWRFSVSRRSLGGALSDSIADTSRRSNLANIDERGAIWPEPESKFGCKQIVGGDIQ